MSTAARSTEIEIYEALLEKSSFTFDRTHLIENPRIDIAIFVNLN